MHTHQHDHSHGGHHHTIKDTHALKIAIVMTLTIFIAQVIGSYISGSLALLSDAGHMLSDAGALIIAFIALKMYVNGSKNKERMQRFTFGFKRIEVLAALINGIILFSMCGFLIYESFMRVFFHTADIHAEPMLITSVIGLIANIISAYMLHDAHHLSTKSAYLHVITDLLSSIAVILGGIIIHFTGWNIVDAILSIGISIYILRSAIRLIKSAGIILMDSAPRGITSEHIEEVLCAIHGINGVHDIHIWEIHPGDISISAHIITDLEHHSQLLEEARNTLIEHFHTKHITLQVENAEFAKDHGCDHCSSREE
ncbi:MAG: cation transporter [Bacteroidetes bacterium]|nr:cation transporter [bacterium]NBP63249.1 cation transporter [Bacteroidota bacterium]